MKWQPKTFVYVLAGSVVALLLLAVGNHTLNADRPHPWVTAGFFFGFTVAVAAVVPLIVRGFLRAQTAIGNGELPLLRLLTKHEQALSYAVWSLFALGLLLALPALLHEASSNGAPAAQPELER